MQIPINKYRVIRDGLSTDEQVRMPEEIFDRKDVLFLGSIEGDPSMKDELLQLISVYPDVPMLKYFLGQWYKANDQDDVANKIFKELSVQYPDFVLGHSTYISSLFESWDIDAIGDYFDDNYDIGYHFPNRKEFDPIEYSSFMSNVVNYLIINDMYDAAEAQLELVVKTIGENEITEHLYELLTEARNEYNSEWNDEDEDEEPWDMYEIKTPTLPQRSIMVLPSSADYQFLYSEYEWDIDVDELTKCIEENKAGLITELRGILNTAIIGSEYCYKEEEWSSAVLHAFFLLPHLDDEETFSDILFFMSQPEIYIDFWLVHPRSLEPYISHYFKTFSDKKLQSIKDFLLLSPGNSNSKIVLTQLLAEFVHYTPDAKQSVKKVVNELLEHYIAHKEDKFLVDPEVVDSLVYVAINTRAKELIPIIKQVYELEITSSFQGSLENCIGKINDQGSRPVKKAEYPELFEQLSYLKEEAEYERLMDNDNDDEFSFDDFEFGDGYGFGNKIEEDEDISEFKSEFQIAMEGLTKKNTDSSAPKPAKNAPCPCGSGKKYKRCHGL